MDEMEACFVCVCVVVAGGRCDTVAPARGSFSITLAPVASERPGPNFSRTYLGTLLMLGKGSRLGCV